MNSRNGLKLLAVTLLLLGAAMLNHDGTRRSVGKGWRMVHAPQSVRLESVVKGARHLLEGPFLWLAGHGRV